MDLIQAPLQRQHIACMRVTLLVNTSRPRREPLNELLVSAGALQRLHGRLASVAMLPPEEVLPVVAKAVRKLLGHRDLGEMTEVESPARELPSAFN